MSSFAHWRVFEGPPPGRELRDFSDRDFYDRAYAPSPRYEDGYLQYRDADVAPVAQAPAPAREEIMLLAPPGGLPLEATTAAIGAQGEAEGGLVREPAAY